MSATDPPGERPSPRPGRLRLSLTVHLVVSATEGLDVETRFSYDSTDPLAVRMDFPDAGGAAPWVLSRDLLHEGLRSPCGDGDVRVWPPCRCHGTTTARIALRSAEAAAVLYVPAEALRRWLTATYREVPAGDEGRHVRWDDLVARLLRRDRPEPGTTE
ncbi:SsgA family sporulation/cell division regulator [Streptomyces sp. TG1A-8]|uniref:SsgA family sporulation/cell division regulator n=1 Tax=Streptomyces sp. TG1A-8 TaxID=3051385 RepID=UPI00265BA06F|nr:SsgA family sporulation/cell division regulator [Streptomyces sp. TG1A-8]MDO0924325.1 SsgA family sporulation/cell division regulator [Streptomyces sp. TG1A-8]